MGSEPAAISNADTEEFNLKLTLLMGIWIIHTVCGHMATGNYCYS